MTKRITVFDYFTQVFVVFGFSILFVAVFCFFFGEEGKEVSTMFALGKEGITIATLAQYFFMTVMIVNLKMIFFTDALIKNWPIAVRTAAMFVSVIVMVAIFARAFGWFPVDMVEAWIGFFISFFVSAIGGYVISSLKERSENKKLQNALDNFQRGEE